MMIPQNITNISLWLLVINLRAKMTWHRISGGQKSGFNMALLFESDVVVGKRLK